MLEFHIKESDCYGLITNNCISLDDKDTFGNSMILMELYKIKCFISKNNAIVGFETIYKDRREKDKFKEYQSIFIKIDNNCLEQEFIFNQTEAIINITIWKDEIINGFEITTNKDRIFLFGLNSGNKIMLNEFSSGTNMVLGTFTKFDYKIGLTALGFYYTKIKEHSILLYSGLFYLRAKIKNEKFYKLIKDNISNMDYISKALLNLSLLPKNLFVNIIKYIII